MGVTVICELILCGKLQCWKSVDFASRSYDCVITRFFKGLVEISWALWGSARFRERLTFWCHLFNGNCSLFRATWCLNVLTAQTVNYLDAKVSMCWVCLPITLKGHMVIIHDCTHTRVIDCRILLHVRMSEIVNMCTCLQRSLCARAGVHQSGLLIIGVKYLITDTHFSSVSAVRREGGDVEHILWMYEDKLVSQGHFLHFTGDIKRRRRAVSDVFLQVCVWAVTQFPGWQGHKHRNTRPRRLYRVC